MSTVGLIQLLYAALAVVMAGLGLSLKVSDFSALRFRLRTTALAISLQMLVLPLVAVALIAVFDVQGYLAVGLVLLAATPGSITSNLYSHLFGGDVAFNITLTGVNTFLCALTLPFMGSWAVTHYVGSELALPILYDKAAQTIGIVVVPVLLGMLVASKAPRLAARVDKPTKVLSAFLVVIFSVLGIIKEWSTLLDGFSQIGSAIVLFNVLCLLLGLATASAAGLSRSERVTFAFYACIHNAIQAIYIGLAVLNEPRAALPAAVYSITMNLVALIFGMSMNRSGAARPSPAAASI